MGHFNLAIVFRSFDGKKNWKEGQAKQNGAANPSWYTYCLVIDMPVRNIPNITLVQRDNAPMGNLFE